MINKTSTATSRPRIMKEFILGNDCLHYVWEFYGYSNLINLILPRGAKLGLLFFNGYILVKWHNRQNWNS